MNKSKIALTLLASLAAGLAQAQAKAETPTEANVRKLVTPRLMPGSTVVSVKQTPYSGLFEVNTGGDIIYTDKNAKYIFVGHVFDAVKSVNITKDRIDEINVISFSELPLDSALKMVKGNGKRVIAIFEDPNCGYCKQFRRTTLKEIDNVTVYTFMYNILSPDSVQKSANVWCAPDRNKAWDDWMIDGKAPPAAPANCATPNEKIMALGQKIRVNGTPAIFFADGSRIPGAVDLKMMEEKLATQK